MFGHIIDYLLDRDIYVILDDTLINISNYALNDAELLKQLSSGVQDLLGENILFSVYPKIGETFLC